MLRECGRATAFRSPHSRQWRPTLHCDEMVPQQLAASAARAAKQDGSPSNTSTRRSPGARTVVLSVSKSGPGLQIPAGCNMAPKRLNPPTPVLCPWRTASAAGDAAEARQTAPGHAGRHADTPGRKQQAHGPEQEGVAGRRDSCHHPSSCRHPEPENTAACDSCSQLRGPSRRLPHLGSRAAGVPAIPQGRPSSTR